MTTQVRLLAGLYAEMDSWISDPDILALGVATGLSGHALAAEVLRVVLARGVAGDRGMELRKRIVELGRGAVQVQAPMNGDNEGTGLTPTQAALLVQLAGHLTNPNAHHAPPTLPSLANFLVGLPITAGGVVTFTRQDGVTGTVILAGGGDSDGNVTGIALNDATQVLTVTTSAGGPFTVDFTAAIEAVGAGLSQAEVDARIAAWARIMRVGYPIAGDLADADGVEVGSVLTVRDAPGNIFTTGWTRLTNTGFHSRIFVEPTPAQIAPGGNLATNGGVVFVQPSDNHPTEIWVRYSAALPLVLFHTLADPLVFPGMDGRLPAAADFIGRIAIAGNHFYRSVGEQGTDKAVTFKNYGPTRVVLTGEPAKSADELLFAGSVANPPIGNYVLNAWAWDRGSEVWIRNQTHNGAAWVSSVGPSAYHHGNLYQTRGDAAVHVPNATYVGRVYIIGHGSSQKPEIITGYTAPTAPSAEWIPIGLTTQEVGEIAGALDAGLQSQITQNTQALAAEAISRAAADATLQTLIGALTGGTALTISAYSATATYVRGSSNSIVTHADGLFIYTSAVSRNSNHDPGQQPGYWFKLNEGVGYEVIVAGAHRIAARTIVVNGNNDRVYLCTTTQTTPRDLAYIHTQAQSIGGTFIHLNPPAVIGDGVITKENLDDALQEEIDIVEVNDYNPTGVTYHAGSSIVKVGTVMFQSRQGYTSSTFDGRTPGTDGGRLYWDTLLAVREVDSDPGDGVDGIMFVW